MLRLESIRRSLVSSALRRLYSMHSEEVRKRISDTCKKNGVGKWRLGMSSPNKGKSPSQEVRDKISRSLKGRKQPWVSESNRSRGTSEETRMKRRVAQLGSTHKKGWKLSEEVKKRLSELHKGEKAWNWIHDRSKLKKYNGHKERRSPLYREWRKNIWLRDNFKCKMDNPECKGRIEAHHILSFSKFPELRYQINNGITLCHFHHPRRREEEKRLVPVFNNLLGLMTVSKV